MAAQLTFNLIILQAAQRFVGCAKRLIARR
jgi:hypothetical protein